MLLQLKDEPACPDVGWHLGQALTKMQYVRGHASRESHARFSDRHHRVSPPKADSPKTPFATNCCGQRSSQLAPSTFNAKKKYSTHFHKQRRIHVSRSTFLFRKETSCLDDLDLNPRSRRTRTKTWSGHWSWTKWLILALFLLRFSLLSRSVHSRSTAHRQGSSAM